MSDTKPERTKELLMRQVLHACPDGSSVTRAEYTEVIIVWPNSKPPTDDGYRTDGYWVVM